MKRFHRILVGIDLGASDWRVDPAGPPSAGGAAFERAVSLAEATGAEVRLLTVLPLDARSARYEEIASRTGGRELQRAAVRRLIPLAQQAAERGVRVSVRTRLGPAAERIQAEALRWQADLIVIGGGRRSGLAGLGGNSVSIFRDSDTPVWVARRGPQQPFHSILAAVVFDEHTHGVLRLAASVAAHAGAPLFAMHVLPENASDGRVEDARATLQGWLDVHARELRGAEVLIRRGSPAETVLQVARSVSADAVFIGPSTRTRFGAVLGGTPSSRLLADLDSSLICARAVPAPVALATT